MELFSGVLKSNKVVAAKKVRVAGDVRPTAGTPNSFVEVVKRGRKEKRVEETTSGKTTGLGRELANRKENAGSLPVVRTPKKANTGPREKAVVSVTVTEEGGSYKDALLRAREIKGPGSRQKARSIAEALKNKVTGVRVGVPVRTGTFKVCGLDPGTTAREISKVVAELCEGMDPNLIRVGEILLGRGGLGQVWVTAPIEVVRVGVAKGHVVAGWSRARIYPVNKRPTRCYRCQARGHVGVMCPSPVVRDAGRKDTDHMVGSWQCPPVAPLGRKATVDGLGLPLSPVSSSSMKGGKNSEGDAGGTRAPCREVDMEVTDGSDDERDGSLEVDNG
ncbi:hypothetical protein M0802_015574 [Mischocyttarus mexicanus]|nr:hypothetical protein M0802_015574 [Mischocyttarus mexicanus]